MKIIGCDFHTRQQQIEMLDRETGEIVQLRLEHHNGEARRFYEQLRGPVIAGIEATGYTRWFEQMLAELGHELWVGDAAQIRAAVVRKAFGRTIERDARTSIAKADDARADFRESRSEAAPIRDVLKLVFRETGDEIWSGAVSRVELR